MMTLRLLSVARGFFRPLEPLRCLSAPSRSSSGRQEATISPALRESLVAQIRENAKQALKVDACNFNCLPLTGTREHEKMMKAILEKLKNSHTPV